jgi:flavin-dependent dehydrogenase
LISPLSGEGIAYALESGEQAALTVIEAFSRQDFTAKSLNRYQEYLNFNYYGRYRVCHVLRKTLSLFNSGPLDTMIKKGITHANLAEKFVSVMTNTDHPTAILKPGYLRYYL